MLSRIAIINRGEPAMRLVHAVQELNAEQGLGLRTIALHTEEERAAMFVREADEAECIGAGRDGAPEAGPRSPRTWTTASWPRPWSVAAPTRRGSAGALSPKIRRLRSCAPGWG